MARSGILREFLLRIWRWWRRLFGRRREPWVKELAPPEGKPHLTWLERMKAKWPSFRFITTSSGLPNAPKKQPCGICKKWVKRTKKTMTRAVYHCNKCKADTIISLRGGKT